MQMAQAQAQNGISNNPYALPPAHSNLSGMAGNQGRHAQMDAMSNGSRAKSDASIYRPYTIKDFRSNEDKTKTTKLGGLGANLGSEAHNKAMQKKEAQKQFAENVRMQVLSQPQNNNNRIPKQVAKEKTSRDKALEFAKNVPKPKVSA